MVAYKLHTKIFPTLTRRQDVNKTVMQQYRIKSLHT